MGSGPEMSTLRALEYPHKNRVGHSWSRGTVCDWFLGQIYVNIFRCIRSCRERLGFYARIEIISGTVYVEHKLQKHVLHSVALRTENLVLLN